MLSSPSPATNPVLGGRQRQAAGAQKRRSSLAVATAKGQGVLPGLRHRARRDLCSHQGMPRLPLPAAKCWTAGRDRRTCRGAKHYFHAFDLYAGSKGPGALVKRAPAHHAVHGSHCFPGALWHAHLAVGVEAAHVMCCNNSNCNTMHKTHTHIQKLLLQTGQPATKPGNRRT